MHDGMMQNRPRCGPADDSSLQKVFGTAFALQTDSFCSGMVGVRLYLEDTCESGSLMKAASDHLLVIHSARPHKGYDFPLPIIPPLEAAVQIHHRSSLTASLIKFCGLLLQTTNACSKKLVHRVPLNICCFRLDAGSFSARAAADRTRAASELHGRAECHRSIKASDKSLQGHVSSNVSQHVRSLGGG